MVGRMISYFPKALSPWEARHVASCLPVSQLALLQGSYPSLNKTVGNKAEAISLVLLLWCLEAALIRFTQEPWNLLEVRGPTSF